ncbi:MAG: hypothetical protein K0R29_2092 [Pseudobdellovibrio sp.]|jgi:hypothetical protein|nr:hypothetical protein [Pseudobdellovibrio sp.]
MEMAFALMIFFILITAVFVIIALVFPEWVGITGKKALEIQKHQSGDDESKDSSTASSAPSTENKPR